MVAERTITVEYLVPSMSQTLLCKFLDTSAFGFNYSESSIWSPLLPRGTQSSDADTYRSSEKFTRAKGKSMKKKKMMMKKKKKKMVSEINRKLDFSPNPTPKRGWNRLLKAAARRFKLQRRAALQMILPAL